MKKILFSLMFLMSAPALALTDQERAARICEALMDVATCSAAQLTRIADAYRVSLPNQFAGYVFGRGGDPANPTTDERAGFVVDRIRRYSIERHREKARIEALIAADLNAVEDGAEAEFGDP